MTKQVERMMSQEEAQEIVDAVNTTLMYLPNSASRAQMMYQLIDAGWDTKEVPCEEAAMGYQIELDADSILEEDENDEEDEDEE